MSLAQALCKLDTGVEEVAVFDRRAELKPKVTRAPRNSRFEMVPCEWRERGGFGFGLGSGCGFGLAGGQCLSEKRWGERDASSRCRRGPTRGRGR